MGESKRRRAAASVPLPDWHSTPEEVASVVAEGEPGYVALKVGDEADLTEGAAKRVGENIPQILRRLPARLQMMFFFEGFADEGRQPEAIPEVAAYVASLLRQMDGRLPLERVVPATRLLLMRCNVATWGAHVMTLNAAGPVPWRLCDVQRKQA
jgi:hypothetical protein